MRSLEEIHLSAQARVNRKLYVNARNASEGVRVHLMGVNKNIRALTNDPYGTRHHWLTTLQETVAGAYAFGWCAGMLRSEWRPNANADFAHAGYTMYLATAAVRELTRD